MSVRKSSVLGLLAFLLVPVAACSSSEPRDDEALAAVPGYTAPEGASALCARLAGSTHFLGIPQAAGRLAAGTRVVEARTQLATARRELRAMVAELPPDDGQGPRAAADAVVAALLAVLDEPLTEQARSALVDGMDELVAQLRPVCDFPS